MVNYNKRKGVLSSRDQLSQMALVIESMAWFAASIVDFKTEHYQSEKLVK